METSTLNLPKTGRSRFSKALPAPPPLDSVRLQVPGLAPGSSTSSSPAPSPRSQKQLPPVASALPASPRPPPKEGTKESTVARPMNSTLPVPAPSPLIPRRRPVAGSPVTSESSPVASITDFLSAYSDRNSNTTWRSSDGTASTKDTELTAPPQKETPIAPVNKPDTQKLPSTMYGANDGHAPSYSKQEPWRITGDNTVKHQQQQRLPPPPPPPPVKEVKRQGDKPRTPQDELRSRDQPAGLTSSLPSLNPSPPSPQIWRRRSIRSDRNLSVTELKLTSSHGSTASTQPTTQQTEFSSNSLLPHPQQESEVPAPSATTSRLQLPRSANGLPGRNIRPVTPRATPQSTETMGNEFSKIKRKGRDGEPEDNDTAKAYAERVLPDPPSFLAKPKAVAPPKVASPIHRLPTPEYDKNDIHGPLVENVLSPVSPASSPELVIETEAPPAARKPVGGLPREVRPVRSTPSLGRQGSDSTTAVPEMPGGRSQIKPTGLPAPSRGATDQSRFPARTSSRAVDAAANRRDLTAEPTPGPTSLPTRRPRGLTIDTSDAALDNNRRDGTNTTPTTDKRASYFPASSETLEPEGTVFAPPPLGTKNFECWVRHRHINHNQNAIYPVACQVCHGEDTGDRFTCGWCFLRICLNCKMSLAKFRGDLSKVVEHVKNEQNLQG